MALVLGQTAVWIWHERQRYETLNETALRGFWGGYLRGL